MIPKKLPLDIFNFSLILTVQVVHPQAGWVSRRWWVAREMAPGSRCQLLVSFAWWPGLDVVAGGSGGRGLG